MAHRIIESKRLDSTETYMVIYIDSVVDLAEVAALRLRASIGSVAYTLAPIAIYHRGEQGWVDSNGQVVGS